MKHLTTLALLITVLGVVAGCGSSKSGCTAAQAEYQNGFRTRPNAEHEQAGAVAGEPACPVCTEKQVSESGAPPCVLSETENKEIEEQSKKEQPAREERRVKEEEVHPKSASEKEVEAEKASGMKYGEICRINGGCLEGHERREEERRERGER
ncbi:MAG: hypothetical protein ACLPUT_17445 [Solirubrobacteraceae bacterium]